MKINSHYEIQLAVRFAVIFLGLIANSRSQTTLSGDHVVAGNLTVGTGGTEGRIIVNSDGGAPGLCVSGDAGVLFDTPEDAGTKLIWLPYKVALRAGHVNGSQWSGSNIGVGSAAFGNDVVASGNYSLAAGDGSFASGFNSVAMGYASYATGEESIAVGYDVFCSGWGSAAFGISTGAYDTGAAAFGQFSNALYMNDFAIGYMTSAQGGGSFAAGNMTVAGGSFSTAFGDASVAAGDGSFAAGGDTDAEGALSVALGKSTVATSYASVAIGRFNQGWNGALDSFGWNEGDSLFEVGIGTSSEDAQNAFTIYKSGKIEMRRQGDILMGEFGNPE